MNRPRLIVLVGPTAVGKTKVALRLAKHFQTEIVSADSRQVYREMIIGTAKPTETERSDVRHHFVNSHSIYNTYDAGTYGAEAGKLIEQLMTTHPVVVLCGGSGLYIKAILEGFDDLPAVDVTTRNAVIEAYQKHGLEWLQAQVLRKDPDYFEVVDRQNPQRLMRALEIIETTGSTFSGFHKKQKRKLPYDVVKIGLNVDRDVLYERIDNRMDQMIKDGLFEEAQSLFDHKNLPALQTVGYQEIFGFLDGSYDREEAVRLLKRNSRRYAKRQLTWFNRDKEILWFSPDDWTGIVGACAVKRSDS